MTDEERMRLAEDIINPALRKLDALGVGWLVVMATEHGIACSDHMSPLDLVSATVLVCERLQKLGERVLVKPPITPSVHGEDDVVH